MLSQIKQAAKTLFTPPLRTAKDLYDYMNPSGKIILGLGAVAMASDLGAGVAGTMATGSPWMLMIGTGAAAYTGFVAISIAGMISYIDRSGGPPVPTPSARLHHSMPPRLGPVGALSF